MVSASLLLKSDAMKGSMLPAEMDWSAPTISMRSWRERLEVEGYLSAVGWMNRFLAFAGAEVPR